MIRSLHIIGSRQFGGAEHFYLRLVQALNQAGHPALALDRRRTPLSQACAEAGVQQYHAPLANSFDLFSVLSIRKIIRSAEVPLVQSYMGRATRLTRVPKGVIHVARLGGFYKIDGYYRHAHAWVGNTRALCDYLVKQGLPAKRVYYLGNFVDPAAPTPADQLSQLRRTLKLPADSLVFFSLGRFIAKKGFTELLDAFARLPGEVNGKTPYLIIAGDGPMRQELVTLADSLGISRRVIWAGWQNQPGPFFDLADIFVCPSREEPLGNVILEAWSHGLPVISTRSDGGLELLSDGENGLLVDLNDPEKLAAACLSLARQEPELRAGLARNGRRTLEENHTRDAVVAAYLDMYRELLG